jgi:imidazolonepropionase-like amidohydrolase
VTGRPWVALARGLSVVEVAGQRLIELEVLLGLDYDLGSVEVGKLNDVIVIDGNPLTDIR